MKKFIYTLTAALILVLSSCGGGGEKSTFTLKDVEFSVTGPLYEGPNPAQYIVKVDLKAILGEKYKEGIKISNAVLKSANIKATDSSNFDGIGSFVMSLASDNADLQMKELAFLNPVKPGTKVASLSVSNEVAFEDYFGEKQFYLIIDAGLATDLESDLSFKGDFEFELIHN